jgi:hypothetical protein
MGTRLGNLVCKVARVAVTGAMIGHGARVNFYVKPASPSF